MNSFTPVDVVEQDTSPVDTQGQVGSTLDKSDVRLENRSFAVAATTGVDPEEVTQASLDDNPILLQDAKTQIAEETLQGPAQRATKSLEEREADVDKMLTDFNETEEKFTGFSSDEDLYLEDLLTVGSPNYSPAAANSYRNLSIAQEMLETRIKETNADAGFFSMSGQFIDRYFLRYIPIGMLEDLSLRSERKGRDHLGAMSSMSPKEFKAYFNEYIQELDEEGFFVGENLWAYYDGFNEATNAGYDPSARLNAAFAAVDVLTLGALGISKVTKAKNILKATTPLKKVAAISGPEKAAEVGEKVLKASKTPDPQTKTDLSPGIVDPDVSGAIRPSGRRHTEVIEQSNLVKQIKKTMGNPQAGRAVTDLELVKITATAVEKAQARITRPVITSDVYVPETAIDNQRLVVDFGTLKKGTPFKNESSAKNALANSDFGPEAQVIKVDDGYVIRYEENLDLSKSSNEIQPLIETYGPIRATLAKVLGSNASVDDPHLNFLSNLAETTQVGLVELARSYTEKLTKVGVVTRNAISEILKDLRDGPEAGFKQYHSEGEFGYKLEQLLGRRATQDDWEAYLAAVDIEVASYVMDATRRVSVYDAQGYRKLDRGFIGRKLKESEEVPANTGILDLSTNVRFTINDIDEGEVLYKLDTPMDDVEYVVKPTASSALSPEDVMGFNPGGRRLNDNTNYFIDLGKRVFMGSFSEKQAKIAVEQINNIIRATKVSTKVKKGKRVVNKDMGGDLNAIVLANNKWNPSIESFDDFMKFASEKGLDITKEANYKPRDAQVSDDELFFGMTERDRVKNNLARNNEVLMDFGGGEVFNQDPIQSILSEFNSAAHALSLRSYSWNAMDSWVKKARKTKGITFPKDAAPNDSRRMFEGAKIDTFNKDARQLWATREIINRRLNIRSEFTSMLERFGQGASEYIFDTSSKVFGTGPMFKIGDPSAGLMKIGFMSAFGFFSPAQFFMQAFHMVNITAISPRAGAQGSAMAMVMRGVLNAPDAATEALGIKRLAKFTQMSAEDAKELVTLIKDSHRLVIDADAIEDGTGINAGISGWGGDSFRGKGSKAIITGLDVTKKAGSKVLHSSLMFFRSGDRLSRLASINTAFLEFKRAFPGKSALSEEGIKWIRQRDSDLSFHMNSSNRAFVQSGVMKAPTQWLSYSLRMFESVFISKKLTPAERARLFTMMAMVSGTASFGAERFADYLGEKLGAEPGKNAYVGIKYGMVDYLLSNALPFQTAVGQRLAPFTAFIDMYKKLAEGDATALETLTGPSGEIVFGGTSVFMDALSDLVAGRTVSMSEDIIRLIRTPSGIDSMFKAMGVFNNGTLRTKSGSTFPVELSTSEGIMLATGFSPAKVTEFYQRRTEAFRSSKSLKAFRKEIENDSKLALDYIHQGEEEKGIRLMKEIEAKISFSGYPMSDQISLRQTILRVNPDLLMRLTKEQLMKENLYGMEAMETIIKGNTQ